MNNCYGQNEDMQQRLIKVYPSIGDIFELLICVPDTDDSDRINEHIEQWLDDNTKRTIEKTETLEANSPNYELIGTQTDLYGNEYEIYCDNPSMLLSDYLTLHNN